MSAGGQPVGDEPAGELRQPVRVGGGDDDLAAVLAHARTVSGGGKPIPCREDFLIFAGSASRQLGQAVADYLDCPLGASETLRFSEGNLFVRVLENVRGRDVFLIQGTAFPANDNFMELLFWIDALKRASAASVTAVIPYFSYAKGDKKDEPRVSIRAASVPTPSRRPASTGSSPSTCTRRRCRASSRSPSTTSTRCRCCATPSPPRASADLVVVAPDAGFAKKARQWADRLGTPLAIAEKRRVDHSESAEVVELIGSVEGRTALIVDDFTISAGTLVDAARVVIERGASSVFAAVSHGLLAGPAVERIDASPIERLFMTDSVETQPVELSPKVEVVSVAGLFGEAIRRIAARESISLLFQ